MRDDYGQQPDSAGPGGHSFTGRRVNRQPSTETADSLPERPHGKARSGSTRPALTPGSRRLAGVSAIYLMAPDGVPVGQAFVDEAVERGVERLVLLSGMSIEELADDRLLATERLVRGSGTAWTIVRANWFNRNFDEGFYQSCTWRACWRLHSATYARHLWTQRTSQPWLSRRWFPKVTPS
jgi:hypothetical protein